jgi:cation diffusion facilitator family transporter
LVFRVESDALPRSALKRFAWLSIAAALGAIGLKAAAYLLTNSVGLLSDAMESLVNLATAFMALAMLSVAARPADEEHAYGHGKAEYFASGVEGTLILIAAIVIAISAAERLITPKPLEEIGMGLLISVTASLVNLLVALVLLNVGKKNHSIALEANARHLLADVWTSTGVLLGVGAVAVTGWELLDPIVALVVAANIIRTGIHIVQQSTLGLMDTALPPETQVSLRKVLETYTKAGIEYHALRTRQAGARCFVSLHVLVPGGWTVHRGHGLLEQIEADIRKALPNVTVFTHLESLDDPSSYDDVTLDRPERHKT